MLAAAPLINKYEEVREKMVMDGDVAKVAACDDVLRGFRWAMAALEADGASVPQAVAFLCQTLTAQSKLPGEAAMG